MPAVFFTLSRRAATVVTALGVVLSVSLASAQGYETEATAAYVIDHRSGQVLFAQNENIPLPPASMSKL